MDNSRGIHPDVAAMAGFALEDMFVKRVFGDAAGGPDPGIAGPWRRRVLFGLLAWRQRQAPYLARPCCPVGHSAQRGRSGGRAGFVTALALTPLASARGHPAGDAAGRDAGRRAVPGRAVGWRRWSAIASVSLACCMVCGRGWRGSSRPRSSRCRRSWRLRCAMSPPVSRRAASRRCSFRPAASPCWCRRACRAAGRSAPAQAIRRVRPPSGWAGRWSSACRPITRSRGDAAGRHVGGHAVPLLPAGLRADHRRASSSASGRISGPCWRRDHHRLGALHLVARGRSRLSGTGSGSREPTASIPRAGTCP